MPGSLTYDGRLNVVRATLTGKPDTSDLAGVLEQIVSSPDFPPSVDNIYDLRGLMFSEVDLDHFREVARVLKPYDRLRGNSAVALVVRHETHVTISKVFKAMTDHVFRQDVEIFTSMTDAEDWILSRRGNGRG